MIRRKAVKREALVHPTTGATWRISMMDDGGFELKIGHTDEIEYVVRHVFQANDNSQISIRPIAR